MGAFLSQYCDDLIAVYDGQPVAGEGGTGQIVDWRSGETEIPHEYNHPLRYGAPVERGKLHIVKSEVVPDV